jgi:hypothetical protein
MIRSESTTNVDRRTYSEELEIKQFQSAVPMAAELAQVLREWQKTTAYRNPTDWVFASPKTHGSTPRVGNMLVADRTNAFRDWPRKLRNLAGAYSGGKFFVTRAEES